MLQFLWRLGDEIVASIPGLRAGAFGVQLRGTRTCGAQARQFCLYALEHSP